jgi:carbon-monoxide dehydrogenase medium subunit
VGVKAFDYVSAQSIEEAVTTLARAGEEAYVLAGGTDLLVQLRENRRTADVVVDIKRIPEVNELTYDPLQGLSIGAGVSCLRIWSDPAMLRHYPGLVDSARIIGSVQVQGRATFGGNLANASPAADSIPALIAHGARCVVAGAGGMREIPAEEFCVAPGRNALQKGEFLIKLLVQPPAAGFGAGYLRFIPRNEMDIAVVGVGAAVLLDASGDAIQSARIALGAVAPTPILARAAGEFLQGKAINDETIAQAAQIAMDAARPITDMRGTIAQRKHLVGVLTRRTLGVAIQRARENLHG